MSNKDNALHRAASRGHAAVVRRLIDAGILVDVRRNTKYTALFSIIYPKHAAVASALLSIDADSSVMSDTGFSVLHHAADNGNTEMMQILPESSTDPNILDKSKRTPVQATAQLGHEGTFCMMFKAGGRLTGFTSAR